MTPTPETIRRAFLWQVFARQNPVLPPRRRKKTAQAWAEGAHALAAHVAYLMDDDVDSLVRWAASETLDAASAWATPPCFQDDLRLTGTLRRNAKDRGGVGGALLTALTEVVLDLHAGVAVAPDERQWVAWTILYPKTATLGVRPFVPEEVLAEWELVEEQTPAECVTGLPA